jgi:hypothetical protein
VKCPCCKTEVEDEILTFYKSIHLADGRRIYGPPGAIGLLDRLLDGPVEADNSSFYVNVSRLRGIFLEAKLPYMIFQDHGTYTLHKYSQETPNVKNNNNAECAEDVRAGRGLYDVRRGPRGSGRTGGGV